MTVTKAQLDLLRETSNSWLDSHDSDDGEFDEYSVALAMRALLDDYTRLLDLLDKYTLRCIPCGVESYGDIMAEAHDNRCRYYVPTETK